MDDLFQLKYFSHSSRVPPASIVSRLTLLISSLHNIYLFFYPDTSKHDQKFQCLKEIYVNIKVFVVVMGFIYTKYAIFSETFQVWE